MGSLYLPYVQKDGIFSPSKVVEMHFKSSNSQLLLPQSGCPEEGHTRPSSPKSRTLSLSLSLSQHICITLVIASHLQRIWAWVHKHPWLHVNACGVSKSFEQFRCTNEEENRSRRRTRRSYIYVYVYVCAFLEIAHLITVPPPYRYQLWNNLFSIFIFGMMRKDYSVPSWMESCTVGVVTSVVRIFLCSD